MTCDQARQRWHDAFDTNAVEGGAEARLNEPLEAHLATCPLCRRYVDDMSVVRAAFDRLRQDTRDVPFYVAADWPPGAGDARVVQPAGHSVRPIPWLRSHALGLAAALALASLLGVAVFRPSIERRNDVGDSLATAPLVAPASEASVDDALGDETGIVRIARDTTNEERTRTVELMGISLRGKSAGTSLAKAMPSVDSAVQMYWIVPVVGGNHVAGDS